MINLWNFVMSKNDITGDSIITKSSQTYRNNYDSIFRKKESIQENTIAAWSISLDVECPHCKYEYDILSETDFWTDTNIKPIEHDTPNSRNYEVECPKCEKEFLVDFTY